MNAQYLYTSMTRIADLQARPFDVKRLPLSQWAMGNYVVAEIINPGRGDLKLELPNGRMMEPMKKDLIVGAFGARFATLEATGSWEEISTDGHMHLLTGAGLLGRQTSKSAFVPELIEVSYVGHIIRNGHKVSMRDFVPDVPIYKLTKPIVLMVGTSMSAGKTTAARIVTRQFKQLGLKVVGAKITGAGRYRDVLTVKDAGADYIYDFVDVGLPSTICPPNYYRIALKKLISLIEATDANVAVVEIGASPLEPYNGDIAISEIKNNVKCTILCASDPYAVYGVMKSFNLKPSIVSGVATNTLAGIQLIEKLCGVTAINIIDPEHLPKLRAILGDQLDLNFESVENNVAELQS